MQPIRTVTLEEFFSHSELIATGYPGNKATIVLRTSFCDEKLADLGKFDNSGKIPFIATTVLDTLGRSTFAVGRIGIGRTDNIKLTETLLLNISRVIELLESEKNIFWAKEFDWNWKDSLDVFHRAINQELVTCSIDICEDLPEELRHWGREILACASIFDDVQINGFHLKSNSAKYMEALEWYKQARSLTHAEKGSSIHTEEFFLIA